ncbi:MAG: class I SAM-dependent methyltransferase [Mycobacterium sp.]
MVNPPSRPLSPSVLHEAMARRLYRRAEAHGEIRLLAVPGMIDEYVKMCDTVFNGVGVRFTADELARLKTVLKGELTEAFAASPRSYIIVSYNSPVGTVLNYNVRPQWGSIEGAYEDWLATREPPLFGTQPDARVWALAGEAIDPAGCRVLDIGAGTGRNSLALARRGHPVDAVEMTPKFAEMIRAEARQQFLDVRVIERDLFTSAGELGRDYQLIVLSEVVSDFRSFEQLRHVLELADQHLARGGRLVFNAFLPRHGYVPDEAARQLGQQTYTTIFTWEEMNDAAAGLPLQLVSDESVYDYEKAHLPEGSWPQTSWYANWVDGLDVFGVERAASPIEMRWLVYQKLG